MQSSTVVIIGAGGHGQTIAEALFAATRAGHPVRAAGFLDDTPELRGTTVAGLPVLGPLSHAKDVECDAFIVGIGDNRARKRIFDELRAAALTVHTVIHPTAVIATTAHIGEGTYIGANALIGAASAIGDDTIINGAGCVGHHNRIGAHAHLGPGVNAAGHVIIGDGCEIGTGANFLPDASVGAWSTVMGGALVAGSFEGGALIGGAPARLLRRLDTGERSEVS
ncbi:NeuD/PglB/VioB family sugar acetyltransferase [Pseudazoarcus pumilus]|nr:NeuD/PglB/VioB family sugar acetyltransferase [Pseudazoarcus pumilus]